MGRQHADLVAHVLQIGSCRRLDLADQPEVGVRHTMTVAGGCYDHRSDSSSARAMGATQASASRRTSASEPSGTTSSAAVDSPRTGRSQRPAATRAAADPPLRARGRERVGAAGARRDRRSERLFDRGDGLEEFRSQPGRRCDQGERVAARLGTADVLLHHRLDDGLGQRLGLRSGPQCRTDPQRALGAIAATIACSRLAK